MTISLTGAGAFIGPSPSACAVRAQVAAFAASDANVLVVGASGTGKELVARALHDMSPRRDNPFVAIDCGALTESLAESELFGHARGAFTGAVSPRRGLLVEAGAGTLLLDEASNASPQLQARLLRVLEQREVRPVGGNRAHAIDARVIAATNRDLMEEVDAGRFREDLLFRLDVLRIELPSLADRRDDVPDLVEHLLERVERRTGLPLCVSEEALSELGAREWPGNVRQLRNALERAVALARGSLIEVHHLPRVERVSQRQSPTSTSWRTWQAAQERSFLLSHLEANGWNRSATARRLGMSRQALHDRLRRHDLRPRLVAPEAAAPSGGAHGLPAGLRAV